MRMMTIQELLLQELQNIMISLSPHKKLFAAAGAVMSGAALSVPYYDRRKVSVTNRKERNYAAEKTLG